MSRPARKIAADFAEIPFDNHEARILALAYQRQRLVLQNLVAAVGTMETGGEPVTRLRAAMDEAHEELRRDA